MIVLWIGRERFMASEHVNDRGERTIQPRFSNRVDTKVSCADV